jgi:hypothetical protein
MMKLEGSGREQSWPLLRFCLSILLEGAEEDHEIRLSEYPDQSWSYIFTPPNIWMNIDACLCRHVQLGLVYTTISCKMHKRISFLRINSKL